MTTLKDILAEIEKKFDKEFILVDSNTTKSGKSLNCDPNFVKSFIRQAVIRACREMNWVQNNFLEGV